MATPQRGLYKTQLKLGTRDAYGPALSITVIIEFRSGKNIVFEQLTC